MLVYCLLAVILASSWSSQAQNLEQLTLPSTLMTRVNCSETIPCAANNASDVQWSTSRFRVIFVNTSRLATWVTTTGSVTTAFLRFTDISAAEAGLYTCLIYFPDSTRSNSISVTVDEDPIRLLDPISYNLSTTFVGRDLSVSCVVQTCGGNTTVTFTKQGSTPTVKATIIGNVDGELSFIWNAPVSGDLVGEYTCTAQNSLGTDTSAIFTIEGTPQQTAGSISTLMSTALMVVMLLLSATAIF